MAWQPEFTPEKLPRPFGYQQVKHQEHLHFYIGAVSDKGLEEVEFQVNPNKMIWNLGHMSQARGIRAGWAVEHAGQQLDQITISGTSAMCVVAGIGLVTACEGTYGQQCSLARNVVDNMVLIFKDNGSVRNATYPFVIDLVGHAFIRYDGVTYTGRFDELEITENSEKPYTVDFSMQFTVHREE